MMEKTAMGEIEKKNGFGILYRFFCWCSGARLYILKKCPTDYNIFFGIGIIVFMTGILASISGTYAFFTIFRDQQIALAFGLFWGILIFFLDWYIVASLRKENNLKKELMVASPRFVLAVFLAIVIARPLELKLFEKEINAEMETLKGEHKLNYKTSLNNEFNDIEKLKEENSGYFAQLNNLETKKTKLFDLMIAEAEGLSPTKMMGKGSVYREKKEEYQKTQNLLAESRNMLLPLIDANNIRITELMNKKEIQAEKGTVVFEQSDGFLSRMEAFGRLTDVNRRIGLASLFIIILFICIEVAPIIVKLMSERGPYDECLDLERFNITSQARKDITTTRNNMNRGIAVENEKYLMKLDAELRNNKEFIDTIMAAQLEIGKEKIKLWKEHEMEKIEGSLENYQPTIDELINDAKMNLKIN